MVRIVSQLDGQLGGPFVGLIGVAWGRELPKPWNAVCLLTCASKTSRKLRLISN